MKLFGTLLRRLVSRFRFLVLLLVASAASAEVRFVSPLEGSQLFGTTAIEVETTENAVDRVELYVDGNLVGVARSKPFRAFHDFGASGSARRLTAVVYSRKFGHVERAEITSLAIRTFDELTVHLVEVPFRAKSKKKLATGDVRLEEDGAAQKILDLRATRSATRFVFVVDRSLSMRGEKLDAAFKAIDRFRARLREDDVASLVLFNHRVSPPLLLERGRSTTSQLRSANASGGTSLRDALLVATSERRRSVVIVISDGSDRNSAASEEATARQTLNGDSDVHAFVLGDGNATSMMRRLASSSGGRFESTTAANLDERLLDLLADINSRYVAVYQSASTARGWRTIALRGAAGISVSGARRGYFAQ